MRKEGIEIYFDDVKTLKIAEIAQIRWKMRFPLCEQLQKIHSKIIRFRKIVPKLGVLEFLSFKPS
jgi:hypothetical protein